MTSAATTTNCTMMRILLGMVLRISEIIKLENAVMAVTEIPITIAGSNLAVTARHEQMPNICTNTGLLRDNGPSNASFDIFDNIMFYFFSVCKLFRNASYNLRQSASID